MAFFNLRTLNFQQLLEAYYCYYYYYYHYYLSVTAAYKLQDLRTLEPMFRNKKQRKSLCNIETTGFKGYLLLTN